MDALSWNEIEKSMQFSRIGTWKIEIAPDAAPRFYADDIMDELIGVPQGISPEGRFTFHRAHIHPGDLQLFLDYSNKLVSERAEIVYRYQHPTLGEMFVRCGGKRDENVQNCICLYGTHQDISDSIRMEKSKLAEQRLAEQNRLLRREKEQQEEESRARSTFLFNMSHDLRTPMNAIIGYANLMEHHFEKRELIADYLQKLQRASSFMLDLLNSILEMSRIENGKETLHLAPTNFDKIIHTLDIVMESALKEKKLHYQKEISITHKNIVCDSLKVREIFLNILSNAVKYTPEGGNILWHLEELPTEKANAAKFSATICDNGIGISSEYLPHLFEPFSREHNSSESGISGTGLGLPIVKFLVDSMDGEISVESESGKGSKITVTLIFPIAKEKSSEKNRNEHDLKSLAGKRILLAEDNELNAEIALTLLHNLGFCTELAKDGKIALDMLQEKPVGYYDLILMDIQMPNMNGYKATECIRHLQDERARIPIIAMTANAFDEDREASLAAGMNAHLAKPIDVEKLIKTIGEVLA